MQRIIDACFICILTSMYLSSPATGEDWLQFKFDQRHSGNVPDRSVATPLGLVGTVPLSDAISTAPVIADGHVYIGDEDGDVTIFEFGADNPDPIAEINMGSSVYSTPVGANDTIYISTKDKLFAIGNEE